jgi:hypothetical protein
MKRHSEIVFKGWRLVLIFYPIKKWQIIFTSRNHGISLGVEEPHLVTFHPIKNGQITFVSGNHSVSLSVEKPHFRGGGNA